MNTVARTRTRTMVALALLSAIAYAVMVVGRIPLVPNIEFLKYDPKDIVIAIGGFIYGPMAAVLMSLVVSLIEMVTVSTTGPIGLVMNVISTCGFACTAAFIYRRKQSASGAIVGLLAGLAAATGLMLLWNYFITPLYMGIPREAVAAMLVPVFLPFNLLKYGINAAVTLLLYKPIVTALRKSNLIPPSKSVTPRKANVGVLLAAGLLLASCILFILVWWGVL